MIDLYPKSVRSVLCLGAHADDIEIGCGGTILEWSGTNPDIEFHWVVFSAAGARRSEAEASAHSFMKASKASTVQTHAFTDGFFPSELAGLKQTFEELKSSVSPDLVFTHHSGDLHQDHRVVSELTWNTFRNQLILEYEIPKYDGDLGRPSVFVALDENICEQKITLLHQHFATQAEKAWFDRDTFRGLMRLRGVECAASGRFAEAFYARKLRVSLGGGRSDER